MQETSSSAAGIAARPPFTSATLPETGFVRQKVLLRYVPFSKSTLWRRVNAGQFPAPVRLSAGITAWRAEDVHHWIAEQGAKPKCVV